VCVEQVHVPVLHLGVGPNRLRLVTADTGDEDDRDDNNESARDCNRDVKEECVSVVWIWSIGFIDSLAVHIVEIVALVVDRIAQCHVRARNILVARAHAYGTL